MLTGSAAERVVIDTNVLLDWLVFGDPAGRAVGQAIEGGTLRWVATAAMADECRSVLTRGLGARWPVTAAATTAIADVWMRRACMLPPPTPDAGHPQLVCTDADDQKFIDLALGAQAPWLLTRDRALLRLARRARVHGIQVVTPAAWRLQHDQRRTPCGQADTRT